MRAPVTATVTATFVTILAASSAQAQDLPTGLISGISTGCLSSLANLLLDNDLSSCMALSQAITTFGTLGDDDSVVPAAQTFLSSAFCPAPVCQLTTLASANLTLNNGCQAELDNVTNPLPYALSLLVSQYNAVKTASCYEDTAANNQLCIVQSLSNAQSSVNQTLSLATIQTLTGGNDTSMAMDFEQTLLTNKTFLCTPCNKMLVQVLGPALPVKEATAAALQGNVSQTCGADFLTSQSSSLTQTGKVNDTSSSSGSDSDSNGAPLTSGAPLAFAATAITALLAAAVALVA